MTNITEYTDHREIAGLVWAWKRARQEENTVQMDWIEHLLRDHNFKLQTFSNGRVLLVEIGQDERVGR